MTKRREILKFAGGSVVGALFTPAPWRLITDTALWSENWPGIPRPARGEIRAKFTNCALCGAGCAVRARCVGDQPVALAGARGGLCPFGLTGHHLPYHPARIRRGPAKAAEQAVAEAIAKCGPEERVAVLDLRPGRTASWTYRRAMAAVKNGVYLAPPQPSVAVDLGKARTVLSLGAPLLDGWGTPANVIAARPGFRLIQVEPVESRTAAMADEWIPDTAHLPLKELQENGPPLVIDEGMSPAAVGMNVQLGAWGKTVFPRREAPVPDAWAKVPNPTALESLPDRSVRVLLIDESVPGEYIPWPEIQRKLVAENPVVVAFAWSHTGYARYAHFVLPAPVYPEALDDIPPAIDSPVATFRISNPLVPAPEGLTNPVEFVANVAGISAGQALRERADAIHKGGRGTLLTYADGKSVPVKEVKPDDFWNALNAGGCWVGEEEKCPPAPQVSVPKAETAAADPAFPLAVMFTEERAGAALISPLMTKLYQESNLRLAPNRVALHPDVARTSGVADGDRAVLETRAGKIGVEVTVDSSVPPGAVLAAARPGILDVCGEPARAKVVRA